MIIQIKFLKELFKSLLNRYQIGLGTSIKGSNFTLTIFIYCITNVIKWIQIQVDHIYVLSLDKKQKINHKLYQWWW